MNAQNDFEKRPIYRFLMLQTFVVSMALMGWQALYTNFAVDMAGVNGAQNGMVQSLREVPGLLSITLLLCLFFMSESRLSALSIVLCGFGVCLTGFMPSFSGLLFCALTMSLGYHYFESINQSQTLQNFNGQEAPIVIGRLRSMSAAGSFLVGAGLFGLTYFVKSYTLLFIFAGTAATFVGVRALLHPPASSECQPQRKGLVIQKKYWLFYVLTALAGGRRQIFNTFSVFLLVDHFNFSVQEMTALFLFNNLVTWFLSRLTGKVINSVGERPLLTIKYLLLIGIFLAYAHSGSKWFIVLLYIAEQLLFNLTIAIRTFFQKIADPADISGSMAMGVTMNHIGAVVVPALGGILWMFDYRLPFYMGVIFAAVSCVMVQFIGKELALAAARK